MKMRGDNDKEKSIIACKILVYLNIVLISLFFAKTLLFADAENLPGIRQASAEGPSYKGKTVNQWIEELKKQIKQNRVISFSAAAALEKMGPAAEAAIPVLIEALENGKISYSERGNAAWALGGIGKAAVPSLIKTLENGDRVARGWAAYALSRIGPAAKAAVPALTKILDDEWWWVRQNAAGALGNIGPAAKAAVPALIRMLSDKKPAVRNSAAWTLRNIGPAAKAAVPALKRALKDENKQVREAAREALNKIQGYSQK